MEIKTKLKFYDTFSFGTFIIFGSVILMFVIWAVISEVYSTHALDVFFSWLLVFLAVAFFSFVGIFWFSMIGVCDAKKYPDYYGMVVFFGAVWAYIFYFKVYRKTFKS